MTSLGKRREQKHLTEEEIEKLKAACDTFSDQLIVYGLLYTGMRVNELCHLPSGWIDLGEGTITIPREENGWHPKIVKILDNFISVYAYTDYYGNKDNIDKRRCI